MAIRNLINRLICYCPQMYPGVEVTTEDARLSFELTLAYGFKCLLSAGELDRLKMVYV